MAVGKGMGGGTDAEMTGTRTTGTGRTAGAGVGGGGGGGRGAGGAGWVREVAALGVDEGRAGAPLFSSVLTSTTGAGGVGGALPTII